MENDLLEVHELLKEIRDLLVPISAMYKKQYSELQQEKLKDHIASDERKRIFPLLFDEKKYTQTDIARIGNVNQSTVSRFVAALLTDGLIVKRVDRNGKEYFENIFGLVIPKESGNTSKSEL